MGTATWALAMAVTCSYLQGMDAAYHYPPELLNLLVDTVPRLCRSKDDVLLFFRGAGAPERHLSDLQRKIAKDRNSIRKFEIARTVLTRLNEGGDQTLRARREVIKRVVEFEEFSSCWPDDQLPAQGLVARVRDVVNVKDSFTRMRQEREAERRRHQEDYTAKAANARAKREEITQVHRDLAGLFVSEDAQKRGRELERILNALFRISGISVRESFTRSGERGEGVLEQIDGAIELEGHLYLVEMKWLSRPVSPGDVSRHIVRVISRSSARGLFISATELSDSALETCRDALPQAIVTLCLVQEVFETLERGKDIRHLLRKKIHHAVLDKRPFVRLRIR